MSLIKDTLNQLLFLIPLFYVAVVIGTIIELYSPAFVSDYLINSSPIIAITIAATAGLILPIPRYATYPIALALLTKGASYGVILALISGEVVFESVARDALEIKYFGLKFFSLRAVVSLVLIIITGVVTDIIL